MFKLITFKNHSITRLATIRLTSHSAAAIDGNHEIAAQQAIFHPRIGKREIVSYGLNGQPQYFDHPSCPLPSIRWQADTPELLKLKEKAKGDWSNLSIEDKKALYRADFCQTISEIQMKGNGDWKFTIGCVLGFIGISLWLYCLVIKLIYSYPRLESSSLEHQTRMLERMIAESKGKIHGPASQWDYEKGDWKKSK